MSSARRIPGLDGLRALSIVMVLASHVAGSAVIGGAAIGVPHIPLGEAHAWGKVGVRVFFVISGFLITKLLLDEGRRHGGVSIGAFYVRRAYRILPAYLAYLAVLITLRTVGWVDIPTNDLVHAATYTTNFDVERSWLVSHIWSLSVEEHYYLVWPIAFALLRPKYAFYAALGACLLSPIARYLVFAKLPGDLDALVWQATPCVADSIATGCLLAYARDRTARVEVGGPAVFLDRCLEITRGSSWTYLALLPAFFTYLLEDRPTIWTLAAVSFSNVAFAIVVDRAVTTQSDFVGRVLCRPWIERLGVLSYSLYLWQQLFIRQSVVDDPPVWAALCAFPVNIVVALACAHLSYEGIERVALRRRPRWSNR
ncbi:MAG: acyltransferase [Polyangiaceae bacterium]|nr:acyltransferase [Polyangiaceae bacterium]